MGGMDWSKKKKLFMKVNCYHWNFLLFLSKDYWKTDFYFPVSSCLTFAIYINTM